jgi:transposase
MAREVLNNEQWKQLEPLFPRFGPKKNRRRRLEGILWVHRTGAPWRDVPGKFGKWQSVQSAFERWSKSAVWQRLWKHLRQMLGEDPRRFTWTAPR